MRNQFSQTKPLIDYTKHRLFDPVSTICKVTTLHQAVRDYLEWKEHRVRYKTFQGYQSCLKGLLDWAKPRGLANQPISQLTIDKLELYFTDRREKKQWVATTHNTERKTMRVFFAYCQERGFIRVNPARGIKGRHEEIKLHEAYSDDQIQLITNYLKEQNTPKARQLYQFIQWLYYTCIRPKELMALTIGDIRWQTETILVRASISKNGLTEPVDLTPGLRQVIAGMDVMNKPASWYIFGNQARGVVGDYFDPRPGPKPVGPNFFSKHYRQVLQELGIGENYTLYGWKHTRNVHYYTDHKDLIRLMHHNRHSDPLTTVRYLRSMKTRCNDSRRI